jgi:CHAT domain-containing protein
MTESKEIIANKIGSRTPMYAQNQTNLATVYIAQKKYDQAFNSLELAEKIWLNKVGKRNNINAAEIYVLKGDLYYQQYNYAKAEEHYDKSKKLYEKFFNKQHPDYVKVISKLSKVYYMSGDTRKAKKFINESIENYNGFIKKYFPALSEREKAKFWNTIKDDYEFYNTIAFRTMNEDPKMLENVYNNALTTKSLLLSSSLKIKNQILNSGNDVLVKNYQTWIGKKELLTQALSMNSEQQLENGINAANLANEVELLEKNLSETSAAFSKDSEEKSITWEQIRNVLKPNEVAVEMVRYRKFDHVFTDSVIYAALYLKNEKASPKPKVSLMTNGKDLEHKYFKFYRNSIIYKMNDTYSNDAYWKPIKNFAGELSTIYLSADGVYNQINMEAIPTGDGKYVLDNSNIILVSNTKDIFLNKTRTRIVQTEKRALMFGNPDFYQSATASNKIADLPGTEKEINELHALLKEKGWVTEDYMELEANEDQLKTLNNPKIFHIATHGFFKPSEDMEASKNTVEVNKNKAYENPLLRTGLLLKGAGDILDKTKNNYNTESGILTAYEAMNLNLDQTELVVLSACETGLGDLEVGEGVYGLQRAFLVAGAKTLIMSMFKVDDDATQQLMVTFYRGWLETGEMRASFIQAKKEVRNTYKDPIYWGAFIMIGME